MFSISFVFQNHEKDNIGKFLLWVLPERSPLCLELFSKKNTRKSIRQGYSLFCYYTRFLCEMITSLDATIRLQSPWTIANLAYCCKSVGSYVPVVIWAGTKALYGSTPPWRFAIYSFCQIGAICGIRPLQTHAPLSRTLHVFFKHIYSKDFMLFHLNRA